MKRLAIFLPTLAIVAVVEMLVMFLLPIAHLREGVVKNLLDSVLLIAVCAPLFYALDCIIHKQTDTQLQLRVAALESTANGVVITDRSGNIVWANPAFTAITGYSLNDVLGQNPRILRSRQHPRSFYENMWNTILAGQVWHGEIINSRKDGRQYTEEQTITPVRNDRGEITHFVAIKQDITERKQLDQQFRQAQKMEAVGRLAGGIAHDFNNLLSVIIGYSEIVEERLKPDDPLRAKIEVIKKAGQRGASLTRQLLVSSRRQALIPKVLDLNAVVADTEKMLQRLIGEDVELITVLASELGHVRADRGQIEQVIMNLAVNARDAMPEGGKLIIETKNANLDEEYALRHPPTVPGNYVMLVMIDTGIAMDEQTRSQIFEPFFTTKESGKGTGLGLSTVYAIVKQSGGYVWVYSELGEGTTFEIYLPQVQGEVEEERPSIGPNKLVKGTETILLVEDEEPLRKMTRDLLVENGYAVLEASDGLEALEIAQHHKGPIGLLLTDVVMPRMGGPALAKPLVVLHPEVKVLYMSGYAGYSDAARALVNSESELLPKPFTRDILLRKIREMLEVKKVGMLR